MQVNVTAWCGCDVSKDKLDVALAWTEKDILFKNHPRSCFPRTTEGVDLMLKWLDERTNNLVVHVVMEATGRYSLELAAWMAAARSSLEPAIVNPQQAYAYHASLGLRNKTDSVDARSLALMGKERKPQPYQFPTKLQQELKDLCRYREDLITQRVAEEARLREFGEKSQAGRMIKSHVKQLEKHLKQIGEKLDACIEQDHRLQEDVVLLCSIPGIGRQTAITILAELGDLSRFTNGRKIAAMTGLSPSRSQSGNHVGRTTLSKKGNQHVRKALFWPAQSAARHNPHMTEFYSRLCQAKKQKMVAIGAVMRKLIVLMRALIVSREPYDKDYVRGKRQMPAQGIVLVNSLE